MRLNVERPPGNRHVARRLNAVALRLDFDASAVNRNRSLGNGVVLVGFRLDSVAVRRDIQCPAVDDDFVVVGKAVVGGSDIKRDRALYCNRRFRRALDSVLASGAVRRERPRTANRQRRARLDLYRRAFKVVGVLIGKAFFVRERYRPDGVHRDARFLVARQRRGRRRGKRQVFQNQRDARHALLDRDTAVRASPGNRVDARLLDCERGPLDFVAALDAGSAHAAVGKGQGGIAVGDAGGSCRRGRRPRDAARIGRARNCRHSVQKGGKRDSGNHGPLESELFHRKIPP